MPSEHMIGLIAAELAKYPASGMTAKEMAKALNQKNTQASQTMGKLFFSQMLDRRLVDDSPSRKTNEYIYTLKPQATAAPRVVCGPPVPPAPLRQMPEWAKKLAAEADRLADAELLR